MCRCEHSCEDLAREDSYVLSATDASLTQNKMLGSKTIRLAGRYRFEGVLTCNEGDLLLVRNGTAIGLLPVGNGSARMPPVWVWLTRDDVVGIVEAVTAARAVTAHLVITRERGDGRPE